MESSKKLSAISLNEDLEFTHLELKGAYYVISKICKLKHIDRDIYKTENGYKMVLTKFGFQPAIQHNYKEKYRKLIEVRRVEKAKYRKIEEHFDAKYKAVYKKQILHLKSQLNALIKKGENHRTTIADLTRSIEEKNTKIRNQTYLLNVQRRKLEGIIKD